MGQLMIYVVDNNIFSRSFKNLSMDVFDDIWEPWSLYMRTGKIISVDEVYRELGIWVNSTGTVSSTNVCLFSSLEVAENWGGWINSLKFRKIAKSIFESHMKSDRGIKVDIELYQYVFCLFYINLPLPRIITN